MQTYRPQLSDITYNAALETFEALVTFHTDEGRIRVAAEHKAPLDTTPDQAARALRQNALRSLHAKDMPMARLAAQRSTTDADRRITASPLTSFFGQLLGNKAA